MGWGMDRSPAKEAKMVGKLCVHLNLTFSNVESELGEVLHVLDTKQKGVTDMKIWFSYCLLEFFFLLLSGPRNWPILFHEFWEIAGDNLDDVYLFWLFCGEKWSQLSSTFFKYNSYFEETPTIAFRTFYLVDFLFFVFQFRKYLIFWNSWHSCKEQGW